MNRKILLKIVFACIALVLVLGIVYSGLRILESTVFLTGQEQEFVVTKKTITRNGVEYFPRQDINVILLMGINQKGPVEASAESNHGNAVDMVTLMIFDEKAEHCTLLNINRDTMLTMPVLNERGHEAGTFYGQLAYAHTYGTGVEDSCENTRKTISNFLNGITIDYYVSMNLDTVAILNDAVGGVTVNVVDDFSAIDESITMGEVTLHGEQARTFVQSRWNVSDGLNLARIERQKEYMDKFVEALRKKVKAEGESFVLTTYEEIAPYLVSDLPISTLTSMIKRYQDYPIAEVLSLEGENVLGTEFYEFYPDEAKLEERILQLFYAPK